MTESSKAAAEKARDTYRKAAAQFEDLAGDAQVPEAMRALAEKNIAQTREIYERSKDALDTVLESWERSFDAVGQGAVALNRKVIDIAQRNINSSLILRRDWRRQRTLPKPWSCRLPTGATRSLPCNRKPKRCARCRPR